MHAGYPSLVHRGWDPAGATNAVLLIDGRERVRPAGFFEPQTVSMSIDSAKRTVVSNA
jgi:hypothetical protein